MLTKEEWTEALVSRHGKTRQEKFARGRVVICGLGGLGSRVAELLTRAGVGYLRLVDFDRLEPTNLNRQFYFADQLGQYKADALAENLKRISPYTELEIHKEKVTEENLPALLRGVDVIVEAFDAPAAKALLVNGARETSPSVPLVAASGMAGLSSGNSMEIRSLSPFFYLCGDGTTGIEAGDGLYGARVALCAAQEALVVLQLLAGKTRQEITGEKK
ncbi:sulfur carrier protein ThiS adenylyltransferase ThiF [Acidaminococcus timonensis]|uniref:sulfur carrier protein ThiS adenylyltransferase ThiF n=1 Tax=Acidaminococcus timonensis TaxID=1871002 RepID=UPI0026EEA335|nr:sulfur carrier protein ThiS adenylyltransferase ThiF [Acidaminococcus timonensis]